MAHEFNDKCDVEIFGITASAGIAIGKTHLFSQIDLQVLEENRFPIDNITAELERFEIAFLKSMEQLIGLGTSTRDDDLFDVADILQVQVQLLQDPEFRKNVHAKIIESKLNAEYVLATHIRTIENQFVAIENDTLRSKLLDVQDVYYRVLRNILDIEHVRVTPLKKMPSSVILVAERLLPSDIALLDLKKIIGIVIENGSSVSHVSIIAKSLCIPLLLNVPGISTLARRECTMILDGAMEKVVLQPSIATIEEYKKRILTEKSCRINRITRAKCFTKDGVKIRIEANAGSHAEVGFAIDNGAEGIGLFRSELYYLSLPCMPSVDEETLYYESLIALCEKRSLTIRLLDIGADKSLPFLVMQPEENPLLGIRGVRFLLNNQAILRNHLTSIIRASRRGHIKILVPFVTLPEEMYTIRLLANEIADCEKIPYEQFSLGMMIEVPATIYSISKFATNTDFYSIGTNDLIQYVFAANRESSNLEEYRLRSFPVLLNLVKSVLDKTAKTGKEVSVCGEVAANPVFASCLTGIGIRSLSMQTTALKDVCEEIQKKSLSELVALANKMMES